MAKAASNQWRKSWFTSNTMFLGSTRVSASNRTSIRSAVFAQQSHVTDRLTDTHSMGTSVAIVYISCILRSQKVHTQTNNWTALSAFASNILSSLGLCKVIMWHSPWQFLTQQAADRCHADEADWCAICSDADKQLNSVRPTSPMPKVAIISNRCQWLFTYPLLLSTHPQEKT